MKIKILLFKAARGFEKFMVVLMGKCVVLNVYLENKNKRRQIMKDFTLGTQRKRELKLKYEEENK